MWVLFEYWGDGKRSDIALYESSETDVHKLLITEMTGQEPERGLFGQYQLPDFADDSISKLDDDIESFEGCVLFPRRANQTYDEFQYVVGQTRTHVIEAWLKLRTVPQEAV